LKALSAQYCSGRAEGAMIAVFLEDRWKFKMMLKWLEFKEIACDNASFKGIKTWKKQRERNAETLKR
jgi:hypothetical protein